MKQDFTALPQLADLKAQANQIGDEIQQFLKVDKQLDIIETLARKEVSKNTIRLFYNQLATTSNRRLDDLKRSKRQLNLDTEKVQRQVVYASTHNIQLSTSHCSPAQLDILAELLPGLEKYVKVS